MQDDPLREHLIRYQDTRDPGQIAALFDATAAELWQLAMHLAGDPGDADDLLQRTYVAVIENADRYDRARPAMGWLIGILTNKAREQHRRTARSTDPDRLLERVPPTPPEAAQSEEEQTILTEAIASLPELYRQVVELVVERGIGPKEIARRLDRSPGSVRVQLHRAIALLRKTLPPGLALPAILVTTRTAGLESVRQAVHQAALQESAKAGAGATAATGTSKVVGLALGLGAIGVGGWAVVQVRPFAQTTSAPPALSRPVEAEEAEEEPGVDEGQSVRVGVDGRRAAGGRRSGPGEDGADPAVAKVDAIPFEFRVGVGEGVTILGPEEGLALMDRDETEASHGDFDFVFNTLSSVKAGETAEVAPLPYWDPDIEKRAETFAKLTELGYLVSEDEQGVESTAELELVTPSADAWMRAVVGFEPEATRWKDQVRLGGGARGVFFLRCESGYAVIAYLNTRYSFMRGGDEIYARGVFHPLEARFLPTDGRWKRERAEKYARELSGPGYDIDLNQWALREDPWPQELGDERRRQLAELEAEVRGWRAQAIPLGRGPARVRGVLNRRYAATVSYAGAYAAATFSFEVDTRDDVREANNDWAFSHDRDDRLDVHMVTDDRSRAWQIRTGPLPPAAALGPRAGANRRPGGGRPGPDPHARHGYGPVGRDRGPRAARRTVDGLPVAAARRRARLRPLRRRSDATREADRGGPDRRASAGTRVRGQPQTRVPGRDRQRLPGRARRASPRSLRAPCGRRGAVARLGGRRTRPRRKGLRGLPHRLAGRLSGGGRRRGRPRDRGARGDREGAPRRPGPRHGQLDGQPEARARRHVPRVRPAERSLRVRGRLPRPLARRGGKDVSPEDEMTTNFLACASLTPQSPLD